MTDILVDVLVTDALLAIISVHVVFFYIWFTIGSLFLAVVGMSEIVLSLPIAWFFYRCVLQIKFFGAFEPLCIFMVCAIGADDIFVFMVRSMYFTPTYASAHTNTPARAHTPTNTTGPAHL